MKASEVYLDERLLQKLLDKGLDHHILRVNPIRMSLQEAKDWLYGRHELFIEPCCHPEDGGKYSAEIRKICFGDQLGLGFGEQIGDSLMVEGRYDTIEDAELAAVGYIAENVLQDYDR